jgi:hypothetical protein
MKIRTSPGAHHLGGVTLIELLVHPSDLKTRKYKNDEDPRSSR